MKKFVLLFLLVLLLTVSPRLANAQHRGGRRSTQSTSKPSINQTHRPTERPYYPYKDYSKPKTYPIIWTTDVNIDINYSNPISPNCPVIVNPNKYIWSICKLPILVIWH